MKAYFGVAPRGWLSPALNENWVRPDLLKEVGQYTCDWWHDDQPTWLSTRAGPPIVLKINADVNNVLESNEVREGFARQGLLVTGGKSEELASVTKADPEKWTRVVREAKIQAD